ncbi:unnamed protein product [Cylindrotheca closterium]|uniref:Uncharacterized protein n=1 Tax=Cylindrotheca closterium TaxID=2856 RepID=A0AAD2JJB3_9STRA|nr:unnamed protein product [Cylindrotheca closterium]
MSNYKTACASDLETEVHTYENVVYLSLGVTLICMVVRRAKAEGFKENPAQGAKVLFSFAGIKVILGIVLLITFPGCPETCGNLCNDDSNSSAHHYIYPIVVFVIALLWFHIGSKYRKLAANGAAFMGEGDRMMGVEATSPTTNMKEMV